MKHGEDDDLETYYAIFKNVSNNLKIRKLVSKVEHMELFLEELPVRARERAIRKISMNSEKPETIKFDAMCAFVTKEAQEAKKQNMIKELVNKEMVRKLI